MKLGARLMRRLSAGDVVCLFGPLGAGKTILVKGMAQVLGINKDKIISPTFVLIREYFPLKKHKAPPALYHFDLYRINSSRDVFSLGYEEYLYGGGICVIEWAQRLKGFLPRDFLKIELSIKDNDTRAIKLSACGQRYCRLLADLKNNEYLSY